ncbi:hypothetical protein INR49_031743 [Caranx melampygus]|nr:hypothetical protein INR49_031743 [Caranx melampygus]
MMGVKKRNAAWLLLASSRLVIMSLIASLDPDSFTLIGQGGDAKAILLRSSGAATADSSIVLLLLLQWANQFTYSHPVSSGRKGTPRCKLPSLRWLEESKKQFPHHFLVGSTVAKPCRDLKRKEKPPLNQQSVNKEEISREEQCEGKGETRRRCLSLSTRPLAFCRSVT